VVLACRNPDKADDAVARIGATAPSGSTEILAMDLADLESVDRAAEQFLAGHDRLDLLVNNAGLMATPRQRTAQGFEMQLGVNHLAHFALTGHLMPMLLESGPARVVSISSMGHRPGRIHFDDLNSERRYSPWRAYFQSKLANLLFTRELQRRLTAADAEVIAVAAHPGGSNTNLGNENPGGVVNTILYKGRPLIERFFTQSAEMGALPTLRAATDPDAVGRDYFGPGGLGEQRGYPVKVGMSNRARDDQTAERLWTVSEQLTGVVYPI
jgi:NAD(P)-dependent dehydrogenase (short-subunit alcohol dehydrogenase family)